LKKKIKTDFVQNNVVFLNASDGGELEVVKECIDKGVNVNLATDNGTLSFTGC